MMPAGRRPEAARERDVSSRPREPHSPHRRRHPRGDVLRERDDSETNVPDIETICKENNHDYRLDTAGAPKVEITLEMISAGIEAYCDEFTEYQLRSDLERIVVAVYSAMASCDRR